jgi:hypothetical protein
VQLLPPRSQWSLAGVTMGMWNSEDWQAWFDERAGVLEYDAGMPRLKAEALARQALLKLMAAEQGSRDGQAASPQAQESHRNLPHTG